MTPAFGYVPEELPPAVVARHRAADIPAVARARAASPDRKMWGHGALLNQQQYPACVGFAWAAEFTAYPFPDDAARKTATAYALNHYRRAMNIYYTESGWDPDTIPYDKAGTSIRSGAQVAVSRGLIDGYAWARTAAEIRDAILGVGPVVLGVPWLDSMSSTRPDGLIRVRFPDGFDVTDAGGHAIVLTGYTADAPVLKGTPGSHAAFRVRNSWGTTWGADDPDNRRLSTGTGWLLVEDLEALLDVYYPSDGAWRDTACLPLGRQAVDLAALLAAHPDPTVS